MACGQGQAAGDLVHRRRGNHEAGDDAVHRDARGSLAAQDVLPPENALLNFLDGRVNVSGATTYYTPFGTVQTSFTAKRQPAGQPMTVPMLVMDRCGSFETFVGAGTAVPGI